MISFMISLVPPPSDPEAPCLRDAFSLRATDILSPLRPALCPTLARFVGTGVAVQQAKRLICRSRQLVIAHIAEHHPNPDHLNSYGPEWRQAGPGGGKRGQGGDVGLVAGPLAGDSGRGSKKYSLMPAEQLPAKMAIQMHWRVGRCSLLEGSGDVPAGDGRGLPAADHQPGTVADQ